MDMCILASESSAMLMCRYMQEKGKEWGLNDAGDGIGESNGTLMS